MELEITELDCDGVRVVAPAGEIDTRSSWQLEDKLTAAVDQGERSLLIDCADLDYITSAGLRVLLMVGKRLQAEAGHLALCRLNAEVREVLEVAGMVEHFAILESREEGLGSLRRAARLARVADLAISLLREKDVAPPSPGPLPAAGDGRRLSLAAEIIGGGKQRDRGYG